jgi:hypothetical protein
VATLSLWLGQGEGFSVNLLDYPGQTLSVKWKDLKDVKVSLRWSGSDILFHKVPSVGPCETLCPLPVDEYWNILKRSQLLSVFSKFR